MDVREKLEVIAHLGDHISYKEDIGICYDSELAKVIEDAYMTLKNGVTVQTNADRIRAMSDEELYDLLKEAYNAGCDDATAYEWGSIRNSFEWTEEWLKQPAE